jgi:excisionase family DNA binding protein
MSSSEPLLTVVDIAERLSVNEQTVRNWIDRDELKAIRVGARRVRVTEEALNDFIGLRPEQPVRPSRARTQPPAPATIDRNAVADAVDDIAAGFKALADALRTDA